MHRAGGARVPVSLTGAAATPGTSTGPYAAGLLTCATVSALRLTGLLCAVSIGAAMSMAAAPAGAARGVSVSVTTESGATATVQRALRSRGFTVNRRVGRRLQVVVTRGAQRAAITRVPGVAGVATAPSAYPDAVVSQGVDRTGASAFSDLAGGGAGLRIAVLDLGFGVRLSELQARGELPPPSRLTLRSFDPAAGIVGSNAYGNATDHGELVAQTIYDYAPRASYLYVSYHTPDDFVAAADWLASQRVDIVVHSNNFLDGPFDGTSAVARAVDRAAAAGILWFNSAGNYGEKHWAGTWVDADGDGVLDWPGSTPWTLTHEAGHPLTFHISWDKPAGAIGSDLDLIVERMRADGVWETYASSTGRQLQGAPPSERINGIRPSEPGVFRVRVRLVAGPPPSGLITLFAREDDIVAWSGTTARSVPTPADAAGSISVGAIDWRSNSLVRYSSRGPTLDGRLKPELAAPTGTSLATVGGDPRDVGGTSIAAPNAAGAAAVALATMRASGLRPTVAEFRALLAADAFDLGDPGPDNTFGAGRIRVDVEPPVLRPVLALPVTPLRGALRLGVEATDAGRVATWALLVDGTRVRVGRVGREVIAPNLPTRPLPDGPHAVELQVADAVGNTSRRRWSIVVDNTAPTIDVRSVDVLRRVQATSPAPAIRPVRLRVAVSDAIARTVRLTLSLTAVRGGRVVRRAVPVSVASPRNVVVGRVRPGVYVLRVVGVDTAGNATTITQGLRVAR